MKNRCKKCKKELSQTSELDQQGFLYLSEPYCPGCTRTSSSHPLSPLKLHRKLSKSARGIILRIPADIEKNLDLEGNEEILVSKVGHRKLLIEIQ